jgi:peptidoglycan-associated lipoprotein
LVAVESKKTTIEPPPPPPVEEPAPPPPPPPPAEPSDEDTFKPIPLEDKFRENLRTIYFDYDSYAFKSGVTDQLAIAGNFLMEHSTVRVLIEGHCDERGSSEYNMGLGENRARVVKEYLQNYGISPNRMEITSWGKEKPSLFGCTDDACHSQNRRAEFKLLSE